MNKRFTPTQSTIDNANLVWEYCECTVEEAKHEKQKIMANFYELDLSYKLMANMIRRNEDGAKITEHNS